MSLALFSSVVGGVMTSILLPVIIRSVRTQFAEAVPADICESRLVRFVSIAWPHLRKYLVLLVFSILTALVLVAFLGDNLGGWRQAFVIGYAWDSTIQKITQKA
jgi:Ca2+/Na+ antiporter